MSTLPQHLSSLDTIHIEDLVVRTVIGIFDHERDRCQDVLINITIWTDIARAAASDSIEDAVNYRELTNKIIHHVSKSQCLLLERLVQEVSDLILDESQIMATRVKIEKPGALRPSRSVGVEILRERS